MGGQHQALWALPGALERASPCGPFLVTLNYFRAFSLNWPVWGLSPLPTFWFDHVSLDSSDEPGLLGPCSGQSPHVHLLASPTGRQVGRVGMPAPEQASESPECASTSASRPAALPVTTALGAQRSFWGPRCLVELQEEAGLRGGWCVDGRAPGGPRTEGKAVLASCPGTLANLLCAVQPRCKAAAGGCVPSLLQDFPHLLLLTQRRSSAATSPNLAPVPPGATD